MPKIFSEDDRAAIRRRLMAVAKEQFLRYGLRRTKVGELAGAVGIAKGTFYNFFDSKEDLCLAIYDEEEAAMREDSSKILKSNRGSQETMEALLAYSLRVVRGDSLLTRLRETGEFVLLARGVGHERFSEHLNQDIGFAAELIENLRAKGASCAIGPSVAAGVLRAFVMLTFHENEIGREVFEAVMSKLASWISLGMTMGGGST